MLKEAIAILLMLNVVIGEEDYCSICEDHTMCKYQGIGPACVDAGEGGVSNEEKALILRVHNRLRQKVASGLETRGSPGPQPGASNMNKLMWSTELAKIAQRWADQCTFAHDHCKHTRKMRLGQNIYLSYQFPKTAKTNWTKAIESWYEEVTLFDSNGVSSFVFDPKTAHYTQIVWATTYLIGCGRRNYGLNKIYVCNYGPAGNWRQEPMYDIGQQCTKCAKDTTCKKALCEKNAKARAFKHGGRITNWDDLNEEKNETANAIGDLLETDYDYEESTTPAAAAAAAAAAAPLPIDFSTIEDLVSDDDEEIKREIEDLRARIRQLVEKIISRRNAKH